MERALYINKFRNIGLHNPERIVLNNSLEKGKIGNLVILIGANNSGKSNVLDAIYEMGQGSFQSRDITTLSYDPNDRIPSLSLCCKADDFEWTQRMTNRAGMSYYCSEKNVKPYYTFANDLDDLNNSLQRIAEYLSVRTPRNALSKNSVTWFSTTKNTSTDRRNLLLKDSITKIQSMIAKDPSDIAAIEKECISLTKNIMVSYPELWENMKNDLSNLKLINESSKYAEKTIDDKTALYSSFKERFDYDFFPSIMKYVEERIDNNSLSSTYSNLSSSKFFTSIFRKIGVSVEEVQNTYKAFKETGSRGALTTLENKLNKKLVAISGDFNRMYFVKNEKYAFKLTVESNAIFFEIRRGESDLNLNYQSTGFRWFFDLYFNLLCNNALKPGDILIMDEPATNLHVQGQRELRKFLKDFAIHNDIVIIIATHSPFLIDLDYLDELRVVSNNGDVTTIANDFTTIDLDDPDSLKPVKTSLTVDNHVILDPDKTVVFVEGITDYNYLLTMRHKLNIGDDIVFLPIKGIGDIKSPDIDEKQKQISKELISIKKHNPILLTDSDNVGKRMKELNSRNSELEVVNLDDIDPKFKQIESLFSAPDAEKYEIASKSFSRSALMKNFPDEYEFDKETLSNFQKVFDRFN